MVDVSLDQGEGSENDLVPPSSRRSKPAHLSRRRRFSFTAGLTEPGSALIRAVMCSRRLDVLLASCAHCSLLPWIFCALYEHGMLERQRISTCKVSVRPRAALDTTPRRGTAEIASEVPFTTLRALTAIARASPEEGFWTPPVRVVILGYTRGNRAR